MCQARCERPALASTVGMAGLAEDFMPRLRLATDEAELRIMLADVGREPGFRYFALVTHEDLGLEKPGKVNIRCYPDAVADRIIGKGQFRGDPVMRGCAFTDTAFVWSALGSIIILDQRDHKILDFDYAVLQQNSILTASQNDDLRHSGRVPWRSGGRLCKGMFESASHALDLRIRQAIVGRNLMLSKNGHSAFGCNGSSRVELGAELTRVAHRRPPDDPVSDLSRKRL